LLNAGTVEQSDPPLAGTYVFSNTRTLFEKSSAIANLACRRRSDLPPPATPEPILRHSKRAPERAIAIAQEQRYNADRG